jgi:hypothetical protein
VIDQDGLTFSGKLIRVSETMLVLETNQAETEHLLRGIGRSTAGNRIAHREG